jgi:hypothetical protein
MLTFHITPNTFPDSSNFKRKAMQILLQELGISPMEEFLDGTSIEN